jgi:RNA polymerase sigma factor (sigma-70 family)
MHNNKKMTFSEVEIRTALQDNKLGIRPDEKLFNEIVGYLYKIVYKSLFGKAVSIFKSEDEAKDRFMDAFYKTIFDDVDKWKDVGQFTSWVKKCVYLDMLQQIRYNAYKRQTSLVSLTSFEDDSEDYSLYHQMDSDYVDGDASIDVADKIDLLESLSIEYDKDAMDKALYECLNVLKPFESDLVIAKYFDKEKIEEMTDTYDTNRANLNAQFHRIKGKLAKVFPALYEKYKKRAEGEKQKQINSL